MKTNYDDSKKRLADILEKKPINTPIQEVRPVEPNTAGTNEKLFKTKTEVHVNFWIDATLMEEVKLFGVKNRKTIKQVCAEALQFYLDSKAK